MELNTLHWMQQSMLEWQFTFEIIVGDPGVVDGALDDPVGGHYWNISSLQILNYKILEL